MKLKECTTCGSHSFTGNKCDYCGNVYDIEEPKKDDAPYYYNDNKVSQKTFDKLVYRDDEELDFPEMDEVGGFSEVKFENTPAGKKTLKVMIWILISIIWFAVTVFIPPLFLLTICGLIIWVCRKVCKKY